MKEFLELFGDYNITTLVTFITAIGFIGAAYHKFKKYLIDSHEITKTKDEQFNEVISSVKELSEFKEKNIEMQEMIIKQVQELSERLGKMEEDQTIRAKNNIRDKLIKYYQHYTNKEINPTQSWTEMEAHCYNELLKDYLNAGGNDYIHSVVEPAMNKLTIINIE